MNYDNLKALLHQQSTYIWTWNIKSSEIQVDDFFYTQLGIDKKEYLRVHFLYQLIHPKDKIKWLRFLVHLRNKHIVDTYDIRFRNKDNNYTCFRITTDNKDIGQSRIGLLNDITPDKENLQNTRLEFDRITSSIQNRFGLNIIIDKKLKIKKINNAGAIIRPLSENVIGDLTIDSLFSQESRTTFLKALNQAINGPNQETKTQVLTNPVYTSKEKYLEILLINKLNDPIIQGIILDANDITDHVQLEKSLKKQREEYLKLSNDYETQNKKIKIKNEILEGKTREIIEANEKLIKSESRILSLSRIVNQAITILENGKRVFISDRLAQITGYPIEELYNFDITNLAAPNEKTQKTPVNDKLNALQQNFWGYTKNGEKKYFSNIYYTEKTPGNPTFTFIITTDRTKDKIQNELLRENQMNLHATLESLQKWIIVVDRKGYIINFYKPSSVEHFLLKEDAQIIGKHYTDLPLQESFIEKLLDTGIKVQNEGKTQNLELPIEVQGRIRWYYVSMSLRHNTTGQNIGWTLVLDDISSIKATEMQLKNREAQLFSLINHFPDIVCLKDQDNRWVLANKGLLELYGLKNKPYLLKTCRELASKYPENKKLYNECTKTDALAWHNREQIKYDMTFDRPNQTPRSYEIIKVPIYDAKGNPNWLVMLGRDVTKRKKMTHELEYAKEIAEQADQLKTAFLTNMSHELRTPLNGIVGFSQLLKNQKHTHKEKEEFLNIIYESSNLLLNIINDIIDLSKMETGQINLNISPTNIQDMVSESYKQLKQLYKKPDISFEVKYPETPEQIIIDTDKVRLQQVINNLVSNAFKFTKKGSVTISIGFDDKHEHLLLFVEDTGIGISTEFHKTVFERFRQVEEGYTREYGGAGLGLSITKKIVGMLGGTIELKSKRNQGSTFIVKLPYISTKTDEHTKSRPADISFIKNKKVLAVEDDAGSYLLLKSIFRNSGCILLHAKNGQEAIDLIQKQTDIDLVLMDVQMPVMDGLEATQKIKSLNNSIPIIAQTAHAFTNDREKCIEAGCDDFITKPVKFAELFVSISKVLNRTNHQN